MVTIHNVTAIFLEDRQAGPILFLSGAFVEGEGGALDPASVKSTRVILQVDLVTRLDVCCSLA